MTKTARKGSVVLTIQMLNETFGWAIIDGERRMVAVDQLEAQDWIVE